MTEDAINAWVESIESDLEVMSYYGEVGQAPLRSARWDVLTSYASGSRFRKLPDHLAEEFLAGKQ